MLKLIETQDGSVSVFSERFGVNYHSKYGAVQETRHVFIEAGLFLKAILKKKLNVLEFGFGTGLNTFVTWLEGRRLGLKIAYTAVEAFPLEQDMVAGLNYPATLDAEKDAFVFDQMHQANWGETVSLSPDFTLKKIQDYFETVQLEGPFDLVYYDAFAPDAQPELWEAPMMQKVFDALAPGGVFVTYSAKGIFKRTLKSVGFEVETLKGPPGKREMTRAIKPDL